MGDSPAERLARLPAEERDAELAGLGSDEIEALLADWNFWARPEQRPPEGEWRWWLILTGRGWGKNRTGAEWTADRCEQFAAFGHRHTLGLLNRTFNAVHALQIRGESGLAEVCRRRGHKLTHASTSLEGSIEVWDEGWQRTDFEVHTADEPDRVRGRNFHTLWPDEMAAWRHKMDPEGGTAFSNADFGLRAVCPKGLRPQGTVTTTPKPIRLLRELTRGEFGATAVTNGSLLDNLTNLDPQFVESIIGRWGGTRLGRQEIDGILLDDVEGALWTEELIHRLRRNAPAEHDRRVVAVDPPGGVHTECGIIVAGRWRDNPDPRRRHADVLDDVSLAGQPEAWGAEVAAAFHKWECDAVVGETNYGGEMVRSTIHNVDPTIPFVMVHASRGKKVRAEPIATLYDGGKGPPTAEFPKGRPLPGRVHHIGTFGMLEAEMTTWTEGDPSPNRMDALVWALTDLLPTEGFGLADVVTPTDLPPLSLR